MTPAELLSCRPSGASGSPVADGRPRLSGPEHHLTPAGLFWVCWYAWLFDWAAEGVKTGHRWFVCDICDELQLLPFGATGRPCHLTAECRGTMRRSPFNVPRRPPSKQVRADGYRSSRRSGDQQRTTRIVPPSRRGRHVGRARDLQAARGPEMGEGCRSASGAATVPSMRAQKNFPVGSRRRARPWPCGRAWRRRPGLPRRRRRERGRGMSTQS